jgi:hypothetical protein
LAARAHVLGRRLFVDQPILVIERRGVLFRFLSGLLLLRRFASVAALAGLRRFRCRRDSGGCGIVRCRSRFGNRGSRRRRFRRASVRRRFQLGAAGIRHFRAAHATPHEHAREEDDDAHDGRRHEQEHELLSTELDLVEPLLRQAPRVANVSRHDLASTIFSLSMFSSSMGSGKTIVEFFSEAISVSVCR